MKTQEYVEVGGRIRDGKLEIADRKSLASMVARFPDGDVSIQIAIVKAKRTHAQNRFFHGPILTAFAKLGYHQAEAKAMLCLMFIPQEVRLLDGTLTIVPGHTSDLNVQEFNALIDQCIQLAAEHDIYIADADEWQRTQGAA